jgi:hypothetical protein
VRLPTRRIATISSIVRSEPVTASRAFLFRGQLVGRLREHGRGEELRTWGELGDRMAAMRALGLDSATPGEAFSMTGLAMMTHSPQFCSPLEEKPLALPPWRCQANPNTSMIGLD